MVGASLKNMTRPASNKRSNNVTTTSAIGNRFLYTGREYLRELGLYDHRNRVYSPVLGRFLQTDPIRFQAGDVNIYRYVRNNSINSSDPSGLDPFGPPSGFIDDLTRKLLGLPPNSDCPDGGATDEPLRPPTLPLPPLPPIPDSPYPPPRGGGGQRGHGHGHIGHGGHDSGPGGDTGWTFQVGLSINVQLGVFNGNVNGGFAVDRHGNLGTYTTTGGGLGAGARASGGISFAGSNANSIQDLAGPFGNTSASLGNR